MVTNTQPPSGSSGLPPGIVVFPIPDPGFDPETASAQKLAEYGIIPRPDPQSDLFANWRRLFGGAVTFVAPDPQALTPPPPAPPNPTPDVALREEASPDIPQVPAAGAGSRFTHSENWSGGYIVPTHDTMVVQVAAEWTLPPLSLPGVIDPSVQAYVCSTWVGLDGQRLYLNSSLPQIGVMQSLPGAGPSPLPPATAFCQWWDRQGVQDPIITLAGLPVSEGDTVIGSVWVQTDTSVICHLRNVTTGKLAVVGMDAPVVTLHGGTPIQLTVSGATAEWVLERPSIPGSTEFYPFPRFEQTQFDVWAGVAGSAGPPHEPLELGRSRLIALFDTPLDPARTAFVSMPRRKGDTVFELKYGGFNPK